MLTGATVRLNVCVCIVLVGPPGRGKTTLRKMLANRTRFADMCLGDIIRDIAENQPEHPHHQECVILLKQGGRAGNWIDLEAGRFIARHANDYGCIVEGMRRSAQLNYAKFMASQYGIRLPKIFVLDHPDDEVLVQRRLASGLRLNESDASIRNALADYRTNSADLMAYARSLPMAHELDAHRPLDDLFAEILRTLNLA